MELGAVVLYLPSAIMLSQQLGILVMNKLTYKLNAFETLVNVATSIDPNKKQS